MKRYAFSYFPAYHWEEQRNFEEPIRISNKDWKLKMNSSKTKDWDCMLFSWYQLNPYPWIFGTVIERDFWQKSPKTSPVTSQLGLGKYYHMQIVSVLLYYYSYLKWRIIYANIICQYERKYAALKKNICRFLRLSQSAISRTKSIAQKHVQVMQHCAPDFFGDGSALWFLLGFTDKGYHEKMFTS